MSHLGDHMDEDDFQENNITEAASKDCCGMSSVNQYTNVKLLVGPEQVAFNVEESLLCRSCGFFRNAFSGNFLEGKTKTLCLPDDDPERIVELVKWLHRDDEVPSLNMAWRQLSIMWLFADKYHIDGLQNEIMDCLYAKFASHEEGINISFETLDFIADNTSQNRSSPLRRIFADMLANGISLQQLPNRLDQIPVEFLQDMTLALKRTVSLNGPTNVSLLTHPISSYYSSHSTECKSIARPATPPPVSAQPSDIYCDGIFCIQKTPQQPMRGLMHICTNHNVKLCQNCRHLHHGHRKKLFTFTTVPYSDAITGNSSVVDGYINDSGFYCDGPKCDPGNKKITHESWALMSGDRYHCLECDNLDFCSICIRGELQCKTAGHQLLRMRPTFAKQVPLTEEVNIKSRQERVSRGACWRCGADGHKTGDCTEKAVIAEDVEVED